MLVHPISRVHLDFIPLLLGVDSRAVLLEPLPIPAKVTEKLQETREPLHLASTLPIFLTAVMRP
jgi:hypothetical protein